MNEGYLIKKFGNKYFIRIDKNHEIISTLKEIYEKKKSFKSNICEMKLFALL